MGYKEVKYGKKAVRRNYSKIRTEIELPDLIEVQTKSFQWFITEGLNELFTDISPIESYNGDLKLYFEAHHFDVSKYDIHEAKIRDINFARPLRVNVKLENLITGEVIEQELFMGDFPYMSEVGTFIINGAERVIVSQIVRSSGVFYTQEIDKKTMMTKYMGQVIPTRGAWIEYEIGSKDIWYAKLDRSKKIPITTFMRAIGLSKNKHIVDLFGKSDYLSATFEKDTTRDSEEAVIDIYSKLRQGEKVPVDAARELIQSRLFDDKRYDLAKVGRFKFNQKLDVLSRITKDHYTATDIILPETGEVLIPKMTKLTRDKVELLSKHREAIRKEIKLEAPLQTEPVMVEMLDITVLENDNIIPVRVIGNDQRETKMHVTTSDIIASMSYYFNLYKGVGSLDDIDHLGNRRLRLIGELLKNQFRIGLTKLEKNIKDRMSTVEAKEATPQNLINIKPLTSSLKEFFGSSQLSQFMDQINPIAELTQKRRVSALGTGGLARDRAGVEVRDVHTSHYGRLCPIETPEGPSIGLISSLSTYARANELGFIETPYLKIDKLTGKVTDELIYLTADKELSYIIASAAAPLDDEGKFIEPRVVGRQGGDTRIFETDEVDLMDVSPKQIVSVATACIPFLEHDDASRALMGANMQRQAVPLLDPESPIVGTGMEHRAAKDSGIAVVAKADGIVEYVDSKKIVIREEVKTREEAINELSGIESEMQNLDFQLQALELNKELSLEFESEKQQLQLKRQDLFDRTQPLKDVAYSPTEVSHLRTYDMVQFLRSNQDSCILQRPIVSIGEMVEKGDVIADGPSMEKGELALGRNVTVAFMTWNGYNYEDAVVMSENLVRDDVYTSIHIDEYEVEARDTKLGKEEITREIPNVGGEAMKFLDERGIIIPGAEVKEGDILVGKVTPKGQSDPTPEEKLLLAIFGEKSREVRDTSLRVPHGGGGVVQNVQCFSKANGDELSPGVSEVIRVFIVKKRKISEGDKMAGRHGNKGVISKILPQEDMPYMEDGTPIDIMLNPLGVPSRMNIGQILEIHLGMAAKKLGIKVATPVFDGANDADLKEILEQAGMAPDGKTTLYDGRTGEPYENRVSVGVMYMIKLSHMVDDKLHARSVGPYTLVTQQPMGGKAQNGGQRFGEMEVWALEAYGAAHTLQEMLTVKSDDIIGRNKVFRAIVDGKPIPESSIPESFRVLTRELQALGIHVELISTKTGENEVNKSLVDHEDDYIKKFGFNE